MKVLNLTTTYFQGIDNLVAGEYLDLIELPAEVKVSFKRVEDCLDNNIGMIDDEVMNSCIELSAIAVYALIKEDLRKGISIADIIEEWDAEPYSKIIKERDYGILIDAPSFMLPNLQNDIGLLTNHVFIKYNHKIVPAVFF